MNLLFGFSLMLAALIPVQSASQTLLPARARAELTASMMAGCVDREHESTLAIRPKEEYLQKICSCTAGRAITYLEENTSLPEAVQKNNATQLNSIFQSTQTQAALATIQHACINEIAAANGGVKAIMTSDGTKASTQKGLTEGIKTAAVKAIKLECFQRNRPLQSFRYYSDLAIEEICECTGNYVADRISDTDALNNDGKKIAFEKTKGETYNAGLKFCTKKLPYREPNRAPN